MSKYRKKPDVIEDDSVALSHDELILSFCRTLIDNINNPNFDFDKKTKMIMNIHSYILSSLDYEKELEKENQELIKYDMELFATTFKLKKAIEIAKNIIDWKHKIYYWYEHNFITKAEYNLLKEVLEDE